MTEEKVDWIEIGEVEERNYVRFLDGYKNLKDGYTENPFGHYKNASETDIESEYFLQYIYPEKLHRVSLRTAAGYRITYKQAEDVWNNNLGVRIPDNKKKAENINRQLIPYLRSRKWFREMEKLTAYYIEQGEAVLMLYYKDQGNIENYINPVKKTDEILGVEAFNYRDYHIRGFDRKGEPSMYEISVKTGDTYNSYMRVSVHPSRVIRFSGPNIEYRHQGYSDVAAVYDAINILSTILKASGEAAFRWSTGHPVIFTKDLFTENDLAKLKDSIGDFTRRSWHMVPMEYVDRIDLMGQAGSMLNLKALADISIEQIVMGTSFPRTVFVGESPGVVGGEVTERGYFAVLDRRHTELEWFVHEYFERDINIQTLLNGVDYYELDWGIREVLNKMDQAELQQKTYSNAIALLQICTINECREVAGFQPLEGEEGEIILPLYEMELNLLQMELQAQQAEEQSKMKENQASTTAKQKLASTEKKAQTGHSLDKKGKGGGLKDALDNILLRKSINEVSREWNIHTSTFRKIYDCAKKYENKKEE